MRNDGLFVFVPTFVPTERFLNLQILKNTNEIDLVLQSSTDHQSTSQSSFYSYVSPRYIVNALDAVLFCPACAHFCAHPSETVFNAFAYLLSNPISQTTCFIKCFGLIAKAFLRGSGGPMTSTKGLILNAKSQIAQLEKQIVVNGGDPFEIARLRQRIERLKALLSELGAAQ